MNMIRSFEIGGIEIFSVENKKYKGDRKASNTELNICFVISREGDLVHTEITCFILS